jgi:hypothetical protein
MKKIMILLVMFALSFIAVNAEINVKNLDESYSIGQNILPSVKITADKTSQYLFSAEISCEDYSSKYFVQPVSLKEGKENSLEIPSLEAFDKMSGSCLLTFYLDSIEGDEVEKLVADEFEVTNEKFSPETSEEETISEESASQENSTEPTGEEVKPSNENSLLYFVLFVVCLIILILYIRFRRNNFNKRFNINKGWKLHKRRFW